MSELWQIRADTGGTFTDCFARRPDGSTSRCKVLSTGCLRARLQQRSGRDLHLQGLPTVEPGFFTGWQLRRAGEAAGVEVADSVGQHLTLESVPDWPDGALLELLTGEEAPVIGTRLLTGTRLHESLPPLRMRLATTRATNALLEGKGSATALFVTRGFADLLVIGDQRRRELFALCHEPRPRFTQQVIEVDERVAASGEVLMSLDEDAVRTAARTVLKMGLRHAAVALLHADLFPHHEQRVGAWLREEGFTHVSLSSAIAPFPKLLPRAQSTVANALLTGPVTAFVKGVAAPLPGGTSRLHLMTSAGGLEPASRVRPKDLLLSGPAGGAIGAAAAAQALGFDKVLTLDMGGTSTDVARIDGRPGYRFTQKVAAMELLAPSVAIETVAAGGGSICAWTKQGLRVGPESAGADPGPACYGKGGPLTITDVNLLLGRFDPARAPIPLDEKAARARLRDLQSHVEANTGQPMAEEALLQGLLDLAVEQMADAIRRISVAEGYDPASYALLAFGGAGPQHACAVADCLGMRTVLAPHHAGILSAVGLDAARPEHLAERPVLRGLEAVAAELETGVSELAEEGRAALRVEGGEDLRFDPPEVIVEMRLRGQDTPLQVPMAAGAGRLRADYASRYEILFGYPPPAEREVEVVSLRVRVRVQAPETDETPPEEDPTFTAAVDSWQLFQDAFSTLVVPPGWSVEDRPGQGRILRKEAVLKSSDSPARHAVLQQELLRHRLHSVVEEMGALLYRTAISTNIRERLDFSCAVLDAEGRLVSSAPHIPVHLGALGLCVRECARVLTAQPGDTWITNHPAFGGSHLPDVTLITPVHDVQGHLLAFVANRAHHAEIGGLTPGSMPALARCLAEEGVVIPPRHLVRAGVSCFEEVANDFASAAFPTRNLADNLADLHAQLAANTLGAARLRALLTESTGALEGMRGILTHSAQVMREALSRLPLRCVAHETLDDGHALAVQIERTFSGLRIDFTGSGGTHPGSLNATPAILRSATLYALRLWLQEDLPLNEGLLESVELILPEGFLNPPFSGDPLQDPAVVGGNVEVSQRVVDTLLKALNVQACSQGTMNNLLFGNDGFGYYETIAGGAGAGPNHDGASALHTHMTNTAITDPEILERRFPVRLWRFSLRPHSGGAGQHRGGDGVVRELEFLAPLTVSWLTQHRTVGPYGLAGGRAGACGRQQLCRAGCWQELPSGGSLTVQAGDRFRMETPGGGGWGQPEDVG